MDNDEDNELEQFRLRKQAEEDRIYAQARMEYEGLSATQREVLRQVVADMYSIQEQLAIKGIQSFSPKVELFSIVEGTEWPDWTAVYPGPLLDALDAWDRGYEFHSHTWDKPSE